MTLCSVPLLAAAMCASLPLPQNGSDDLLVIANAKLVPMTSAAVLEDRVVVVRGGAIREIVPAGGFKPPASARCIDAEGGYLLPGLADMHVHLHAGWPVHPLHMYLANGVTTIRDLGGSNPVSYTHLTLPTILLV